MSFAMCFHNSLLTLALLNKKYFEQETKMLSALLGVVCLQEPNEADNEKGFENCLPYALDAIKQVRPLGS